MVKPELPGQLPMFNVETSSPPRRTRPTTEPRVTYARYRPRKRTLCADCIRDIHERGFAVAPPASGATWRRSGPDGNEPVCHRHKTEGA